MSIPFSCLKYDICWPQLVSYSSFVGFVVNSKTSRQGFDAGEGDDIKEVKQILMSFLN